MLAWLINQILTTSSSGPPSSSFTLIEENKEFSAFDMKKSIFREKYGERWSVDWVRMWVVGIGATRMGVANEDDYEVYWRMWKTQSKIWIVICLTCLIFYFHRFGRRSFPLVFKELIFLEKIYLIRKLKNFLSFIPNIKYSLSHFRLINII